MALWVPEGMVYWGKPNPVEVPIYSDILKKLTETGKKGGKQWWSLVIHVCMHLGDLISTSSIDWQSNRNMQEELSIKGSLQVLELVTSIMMLKCIFFWPFGAGKKVWSILELNPCCKATEITSHYKVSYASLIQQMGRNAIHSWSFSATHTATCADQYRHVTIILLLPTLLPARFCRQCEQAFTFIDWCILKLMKMMSYLWVTCAALWSTSAWELHSRQCKTNVAHNAPIQRIAKRNFHLQLLFILFELSGLWSPLCTNIYHLVLVSGLRPLVFLPILVIRVQGDRP